MERVSTSLGSSMPLTNPRPTLPGTSRNPNLPNPYSLNNKSFRQNPNPAPILEEITKPTRRIQQNDEINKIISKLPFEIRESVTSVVSMAQFTSEDAHRSAEANNMELLTLRSEVEKKNKVITKLQKHCEIFRKEIQDRDDRVKNLEAGIDSNQKLSTQNKRHIANLSGTNRILMDSLDALDALTGQPKKSSNKSSNASGKAKASRNSRLGSFSPESADAQLGGTDTQELESSLKVSIPDEHVTKNRTKDKVSMAQSIRVTVAKIKWLEDVDTTENGVDPKANKLRESLVRVAREHYKTVKRVEQLEHQVHDMRSKLDSSQGHIRDLKCELDEFRDSSQPDSSKVQFDLSYDPKALDDPKKRLKFLIENVDERFINILKHPLVKMEPTFALQIMKKLLSIAASAPLTAIESEIASYFVSQECRRCCVIPFCIVL